MHRAMNLEHKNVAAELLENETKFVELDDIQFKEEGDQRIVEGYASIFNNVDCYNDVVVPGAYSKTIKANPKIPMLWQHNSNNVIGYFDHMEEKNRGLYVKGPIIDTTMGNDAYKLVKAGAIKGMSIGYKADKYEIDDKKGIRKLTEIRLYEVSLVTFPANDKANVTRVKKQLPSTIREFEEHLREAGWSREQAKLIASHGFKSLDKSRDAEDQEAIQGLMSMFKNFGK